MSITIILACLHSRSTHAIGVCGFGSLPVLVRPGNLTGFCGFIASHFTLSFLLADRPQFCGVRFLFGRHTGQTGVNSRGVSTLL